MNLNFSPAALCINSLPQGRKTLGFVVRKLHFLGAFLAPQAKIFRILCPVFRKLLNSVDFPQIVFSISELSANCQFARRFSANCKNFSNLSAIVISANCSANCKGGKLPLSLWYVLCPKCRCTGLTITHAFVGHLSRCI